MKYRFLLLSAAGLLWTGASFAQKGKKVPVKGKPVASKPQNFQKGPNSLEYAFIKKNAEGPLAKTGDFVDLIVTQMIGDSLVYSTDKANNGQPMTMQLPPAQVKGDLLEGITMMRAGDSALFRTPLDTLVARTQQPRPEWAPQDAYISWAVKLLSIKTKEQVDADAAEKSKAQVETDERMIKELLQKKGITNALRTNSGLYYVIHRPGEGPQPATGQKVTVNYTGVNYQGETFDSNTDSAFNHVQPFTFELGRRQVIAGWDEGIALLKKGAKATFYIPSGLAYGATARAPQIPANAILIFDVELLSFE